jgi:hypothetical protein
MWTLNNIRIIATQKEGDNSQIIASLNPLGGGTVNQVFGYEDETTRVSCVVVGDVDLAALIALTKTGLTYTLSGAEGIVGNFLVSKVIYTRKPIWRHTLRSDLSPFAPVYNCDIELLEE